MDKESKKPRRKTTSILPQPKTKTAVVGGALPDRRAMEGYLAAIAGRSRDEAIAKALGCGRYGAEYFLKAIDGLKAQNAQLAMSLKECADDLAAELCARYPDGVCGSPAEERRFHHDMASVRKARAALAEIKEKPNE